MNKKTIIILLVGICFVLWGCKGKTSVPDCEFVKDSNCIMKKTDYDIIAVPSYGDSIEFQFYNYGGDFCINDNCKEDSFSASLAYSLDVSLVKIIYNDINIRYERDSSKYGKWAVAEYSDCPRLYKYYPVYVTPLAYSFLQNPTDNGALILVLFRTDGYFKRVIFLGSQLEKYIIKEKHDKIIKRHEISDTQGSDWGNYYEILKKAESDSLAILEGRPVIIP